MKTIKLIMSIFMVGILFVAPFVVNLDKNEVKAYDLNAYDFVDSKKHMDWGGSTKYSSEWLTAIGVWNVQHSVIRKDTWRTVKDITVSDYSANDSTIFNITSSGTIKYNTYYMDDGLNTSEKTSKILQSIGLCLGIYWSNDTTSVMYVGFGPTSLSQDDKDAFDWLYDNQY